MNKRGISSIIATLILVLLTIVLVGVVWVVISNIVKQGTTSTQSQFGTLFLNLRIESVTFDSATGNVNVIVSRDVGQGDMTGVAFLFSDGSNSTLLKRTAFISELGSQTFTFTQSDLTGIAFLKEIDIAPIINSNNQQQVGRIVDTKKSDYYGSCLGILNAGESIGNGIYTIDPDGLGPVQPIQVYCDMTTDGGGWTLVGRSDPGNTQDWGCSSNPAPGVAFGWEANSGNVNDDTSHYSINLVQYPIKFTQILFGSYNSGKTWGSYVYKQTVNSTFLTDWASAHYVIGNPTPVIGGNTGFGMASYIGFTSDSDIYHWRDIDGNGFGLSSKGWATCYGTLALRSEWGGNLNAFQGMVMVR